MNLESVRLPDTNGRKKNVVSWEQNVFHCIYFFSVKMILKAGRSLLQSICGIFQIPWLFIQKGLCL